MPQKVTGMSDAKAVDMAKDWYKDAEEVNVEWLKRAKESYQFYVGVGHWDEEVLAAMGNRPALTINNVFPIINMLTGYQRKSRSDFKLWPRRGGSEAVAKLGSALLKHTVDVCDGIYEWSDAFLDAIICGKGWVTGDRVYEQDPIGGELVIRNRSPFRMLEDQRNTSHDLNRGRFIFETYWADAKQIEFMFPGKAKSLREATDHPSWQSEYGDSPGGIEEDYADDPTALVGGADEEGIREAKGRYFVRECWYYKWESVAILYHHQTMQTQRLHTKKQIEFVSNNVAGNRNFSLVTRTVKTLHRLTTVGDLVLEHLIDPLNGVHLFPQFRITPYLIQGYVLGVLDNLKEPQRLLNKRESQSLHVLNTTAHAYWKVASGHDKKAMRELQKHGSEPGFVLDQSKFGGQADRGDPPPYDASYTAEAAKAAQHIRDISGINTSLVERATEATESGRAKALRQEAGLTISEIIFDNTNRAEQCMGTFLWEMIRSSDIYSEEEIAAVIQEQELKMFMTPQGPDFSAMNSMALGSYGVRVLRSPNAPTIRMANFETMLEAMKMGVPIPPQFLIELSEFPNKQEIIDFLQRMQQVPQGQPQPQGQRQLPTRGQRGA